MADLEQKMNALIEAKAMAKQALDSIDCGEISEKESDVDANIPRRNRLCRSYGSRPKGGASIESA